MGCLFMGRIETTFRPADRLRRAATALALTLAVLAAPAAADAMEIQTVTTPGGLTAWLVEDHTVPIIAVNFAFDGSDSQNPAGQDGLANLMAATLTEGAGDLDAQAYQARLQDLAVRVSFDAGRDTFYGSLRTLTPTTDEAFEMLRLAVAAPRFDADAVERTKRKLIAGLRSDATDPDAIAGRRFAELAFPDHPYGRPRDGTEEGVAAMTRDDLAALHGRLFARDGLKIAVVGAIGPERLAPLLDAVFGALPQSPQLVPVAEVMPRTGIAETVVLDVPQTSIRIALPGLKRDDPDFIPAFMMNHILGGGSFTSWLYEEVRETRGLAYSVGSYLVDYAHSGMLVAATATRADRAGETLAIIKEQFARMAEVGPSAEELAKAKDFLTGSYPLRFDTSDKIASQLLGLQVQGLGQDYIDKRNALIEAVTLEDIARVRKRLLDGVEPLVVTVGPQAPAAPTR